MKTKDAIDLYGSINELAKVLGIDQSAIRHWGEFVPELRQYQLQVLSAGRLVALPQQREAVK